MSSKAFKTNPITDQKCCECGSTNAERVLGAQLVEMLIGAEERAKREAKPDDPVKMLRRMAGHFGYELVPADSTEATS